jgi:hypothetical protein
VGALNGGASMDVISSRLIALEQEVKASGVELSGKGRWIQLMHAVGIDENDPRWSNVVGNTEPESGVMTAQEMEEVETILLDAMEEAWKKKIAR